MMKDDREMTLLAEMAAVVSHEVKNPLAGIGGALQILRDRSSENAEGRAVIIEILDRLRTLDERLDTLLLYARPITLQPVPVSLGDVVREAAHRLCASSEFAGIEVAIGGKQTTQADRKLLDTAVGQLLMNAAQAVDGCGKIVVRVRSASGRARALIEVVDDGPGIPFELSDQVFEPFFTTRASGVGLGLTIARRVAEAHGGSLVLKANDPGTVARLELPLCS